MHDGLMKFQHFADTIGKTFLVVEIINQIITEL